MNILLLSNWFPYPLDNGSKIRVYHLLRALAHRHQVTLLALAPPGTPSAHVDLLRSFCQAVDTVPGDASARSSVPAWRRFLSSTPTTAWPVPAMRALARRALARQPFDVVIASTESMAAYVLEAPSAACCVLEEHNSESRIMWERYDSQTAPLQRLRCWASWAKARRYEAGLFPRFDLVTMVSEEDRAASAALAPRSATRFELVPNGVECQRNILGLAPKRPASLIYNGALTYSANYDAMLWFLREVYPLIRAQAPDVTISITGSTRGVDLSGLALDPSVRLTGYVDDIRPLVSESAVCVVPLRQGGGTRLKILEAMALGTPVVSTSKGAEGLDVAPGEHLLVADEPAEFARATVRLLRDQALQQRLTHNARRLVEARYDWERIGARFVELVEEAVARRRGEGDADA